MRPKRHLTTCVTVYFPSAYRRCRRGTVTSMRSRSIAGRGAAPAFGLFWQVIAPEIVAIVARIERRVVIRRTYGGQAGASAPHYSRAMTRIRPASGPHQARIGALHVDPRVARLGVISKS